jgi:hypothetical protein
MEFVSKQQTYEALRKLMIHAAAEMNDPQMEEVAREMEMTEHQSSRMPALYHRFLDTLTADPLEPQDALAAAAEFLEKNVDAAGKPQTQAFIRMAKSTADDPQSGVPFWNRWIELLQSV